MKLILFFKKKKKTNVKVNSRWQSTFTLAWFANRFARISKKNRFKRAIPSRFGHRWKHWRVMLVNGLPRQSSLSLLSTALSSCWTCQIYMTDITKFCCSGCCQQPTRRRSRRKRKESEGRYSTPNWRQKTEDARCRVCGNVRKQISQMSARLVAAHLIDQQSVCLPWHTL